VLVNIVILRFALAGPGNPGSDRRFLMGCAAR